VPPITGQAFGASAISSSAAARSVGVSNLRARRTWPIASVDVRGQDQWLSC
jgi:hypothetical protein